MTDQAKTAPERIRHVKRGSTYTVIAHGKIQTDRPLRDYAEVTVYRGDDGLFWVRPIDEMEDGRFEPVAALAGEREEG